MVLMPNPFYQIYEGAALLAGAEPYCVNAVAAHGFAPAWREVPDAVWSRTQLVYVCSPDNPDRPRDDAPRNGRSCSSSRTAMASSSRPTSAIPKSISTRRSPPVGALAVAHALGRSGFPRLVAFGSLSKRSNAPGLRSGYVAGDAALLKAFLLYRTYHGSAMSAAVAAASIAAWSDEAHVRDNRAQYAAKFARLQPQLAGVLPCAMPDAAFYLWARTPIDDADFAKRLLAEQAVVALPGSFLARDARGVNPGAGYLRIALVAARDECAEASIGSWRSRGRCDARRRARPRRALSPPAPLRRERAPRAPAGTRIPA